MAEEQKSPTQADIDAMKKELADIKNEKMKQELEEIKRERMKRELADIKAEREAKTKVPDPVKAQRSSPLTFLAVLVAAILLLLSGYLLGTLYGFDSLGVIDNFLAGHSSPITGDGILLLICIILALAGAGIMTMIKK